MPCARPSRPPFRRFAMLDAQSAAPVQVSVSPVLRPAEAPPPRPKAARLVAAANALLLALAAGRALDARTLRDAMTAAFEGSDAEGAWAWKDAYEAAEAAVVLFVRRYGRAMRREAGSPARMLAMLEAVAALEPSHTRRSEEQVAMQQFSTPPAARLRRAPGGGGAPGRLRPRALGRDRHARGARRVRARVPGRGGAASQRAQRHPGRAPRRALSGRIRHPAATRRPSPTTCRSSSPRWS